MQALKITEQKTFMTALLKSEAFDPFLVSEGSVTTFTTFDIDGSYHKDYFDSGTLEEEEDRHPDHLTWRLLRPLFLQLIRGKNPPSSMKLVFRLADYNVEKLLSSSGLSLSPEDISGLFLNVRYGSDGIILTTGTSLRIFSLDKSLENVWDENIRRFLKSRQIPFLPL